jgi:hypothetical protein
VKAIRRSTKFILAGTEMTSGCGSSTKGGEYIQGQLIEGEIQTGVRGRHYAKTADGRNWSKPLGGQWMERGVVETPPKEEDGGPFQLLLVMQEQLENAPDHWSLFVSKQGRSGNVYQVKGKPLLAKDTVCVVEKKAL